MKNRIVLFALLTLALLSWGLYQALEVAPTERTMGDVQRIFYYHFGSAMTAFACFFANFIASLVYLARRDGKSDAVAVATAEVGVVFCTTVLMQGMLWAKPVWGIWWTWDARLTTTLVMWLIYISYLLLRRYSTSGQAPLMAAVLAVFGFVDVPLVYVSNRIFRTQHPQPVIAGGENSGLDPAMWPPVLWNLLAFVCFAILLITLRYQLERARQLVQERAIEEAR